MAIRSKPAPPQFPLDLLPKARTALFYQVASKLLDEKFKATKTTLFSEIEVRNDIILNMSESFAFAGGKLRQQEGRAFWEVDAAKVAEAVRSGDVSIEALLTIAKFDGAALNALVADAAAQKHGDPFPVMTADGDFKAQVAADLAELELDYLAAPESAPKAEPQPAARPASSKVA